MIPGIVAGRAVTPAPVNPVALSIYNKLAEWWTCDSLSGGALVGQHAATSLLNHNSATTAAGKIGNGIDLELSLDQGFYSNADAPGTRTLSSPTSACLWFKPESISDGQFLVCLSNRTTVAQVLRRIALRVGMGGTLIATSGDGSTAYNAETTDTLTVGTFAFVQGDVVPGGSVRSRINNGSWTSVSGPATSPTSNLSVRVGMNTRSVSPVFESYADGVLDEIAIFDDQLTGTEWDYLYNGGAGIGYAALKAAAGF